MCRTLHLHVPSGHSQVNLHLRGQAGGQRANDSGVLDVEYAAAALVAHGENIAGSPQHSQAALASCTQRRRQGRCWSKHSTS